MLAQEELNTLLRKIFHSNMPEKQNKVIDIKSRNTSLIGYPSKTDMINNTNGLIFNDYKALEEALEAKKITHFTPNSFKFKAIKRLSDNTLVGFSEENLFSINCFFVDIDESIDQTTFELKLIDSGIYPSLILKTSRGYQCFWLLEKPMYVGQNKQTLKVAKRISQNIRAQLKSVGLPVDEYCNDLLLSRAPRLDNIIQVVGPYTHKELFKFSKRFEKSLSVQTGAPTIRNTSNQVDQTWYKALISTFDVPLGVRNTAAFTLALANKQSKRPLNVALTEILTWNDRLTKPLKSSEIKRSVKSAFSKDYKAARSIYINQLIEDCNLKVSYTSSFTTYWEQAKPREERKYSHMLEWQADLMRYLNQKIEIGKAYLATTKAQICKDVKIPRRSLDNLLTKLKKKGKLTFQAKAGRNGGITLATSEMILQAIITAKKQHIPHYVAFVSKAVSFDELFVQRIYRTSTRLNDFDVGQGNLFEKIESS